MRKSRYIAASEYERFVQFMYHAVRQADEEIANLTTLKLEQRKLIRNRYGSLREFDVYWEYEMDGIVRENGNRMQTLQFTNSDRKARRLSW